MRALFAKNKVRFARAEQLWFSTGTLTRQWAWNVNLTIQPTETVYKGSNGIICGKFFVHSKSCKNIENLINIWKVKCKIWSGNAYSVRWTMLQGWRAGVLRRRRRCLPSTTFRANKRRVWQLEAATTTVIILHITRIVRCGTVQLLISCSLQFGLYYKR